MIHVELVGAEEDTSGTYTATAEFEASVESIEAAERQVRTLAGICAQQWVNAVDTPGGIEALTVTVSSDDEVSPILEDRLRDSYDAQDVSLRYEGGNHDRSR